MRGYGQFCPVALGSEVFAERWTPLILRELLAGSHRFSELQRGQPRIPRALLSKRLGSLERAGLIERRPTGAGRGWEYHLSPAGRSLRPVVEALGQWSYQWAAEQLRPDNLDAGLLMWFLRRRVRVDRLPAGRVTVQFEFRDADKRSFWLVLHRPDVDLCLADPGFDTDLCVTTDVGTFTRVFLGHVGIAHAIGAKATPPSGIAVELLARGTIAHASHVDVAGIELETRGPIDVVTVHVTFQPGGSTSWHVHPGPALVTVKTGRLTLHRAKGCATRTFSAGQTFLELGPKDVNLTRNETVGVTETVVTFLLPVWARRSRWMRPPPNTARCS